MSLSSRVLTEVKFLLGGGGALFDPLDLKLYEYDGGVDKAMPDVVVFPRKTEDVVALVQLARRENLAIVGRGAGTGLSGGAIARVGGMIISFARMNRILEIDAPNGQAFCQPGVVHAMLNEHLSPHRLIFPPDPGSSRMATIGGMASTNAHGMRALKYGPTGAWALASRSGTCW